MSNKHTPGPWKAVRNSSFWEVVCPWPDQSLEEANECSPSTAYAWGKTEENSEANARLIAAAPELLDALCNLIYWVNPDGSIPDNLTVREAISEARAAIAKATGE